MSRAWLFGIFVILSLQFNLPAFPHVSLPSVQNRGTLATQPVNVSIAPPSIERNPPHADNVRFAVIGDYGQASKEVKHVATVIKGWHPDLIITVGDNLYHNSSNLTVDRRIGEYFHEFIHPYVGEKGPGADINRFFPALGNHDWDTLFCTHLGCSGRYFDYFTLPGNERYYTFSWGPVQFFAIDSDPREPDGVSRTSVQAHWLREQLALSKATWKIVYMHYSPYSSGIARGSYSIMQWPYWRWGADAVLSGHDHVYERLIIDEIPYFVNGLGGRSRHGFRHPVKGSQVRYNHDFGAMKVEADNTTINFQFINREREVMDDYTMIAPEPVPTPLPNPDHEFLMVQVTQPADDVSEHSIEGEVYMDSPYMEIVKDADDEHHHYIGIRFVQVDIPKCASIQRAYLEFTASKRDRKPASFILSGEATANAAAFSDTDYDIANRPKTEHTIAWHNVPAWTAIGHSQRSPDISVLVQEIVHNGAWHRGNPMAFVLSGTGQRAITTYDGLPEDAPRLYIEYVDPPSNLTAGTSKEQTIPTADVKSVYLPLIAGPSCS